MEAVLDSRRVSVGDLCDLWIVVAVLEVGKCLVLGYGRGWEVAV